MGGPMRPCRPCAGSGMFHEPEPIFGWPHFDEYPCPFCRGKGYAGGQPDGARNRTPKGEAAAQGRVAVVAGPIERPTESPSRTDRGGTTPPRTVLGSTPRRLHRVRLGDLGPPDAPCRGQRRMR